VQSAYQYGRGHLQQVAATFAADQDAARREDGFLHVDRHALAKPEWRRAAHLVAAVTLRRRASGSVGLRSKLESCWSEPLRSGLGASNSMKLFSTEGT
jgi:hypothetical protein